MKLLLVFLLIAVAMCAADLLPILPESCNTVQAALCSTKCLFGNKLCIKSDESLGYTCTCINA